MFTKPRPNLVQSSNGYAVEVLGRTGIVYSEGKRRLFVDSEVLLGPSGMVIYANSIKSWNPPFENETIDEAEKLRILHNIKAAFRFEGFEIDVS